MNNKFYLEYYGCSANVADSEIISGLLRQEYFVPINEPEKADVNIIVSCSVKSATSNKMLFRIKELTSFNRPIVVAGCMAKTERNLIERINSEVSLLGPDDIDKAVEIVKNAIKGKRTICVNGSISQKTMFPRDRRNTIIGIVPISSGCLGHCSFCQVRIAKGHLKSYGVDSIISEIRIMLKDGCKEIWLTSQDCGCFGLDTGDNLPNLLSQILNIKDSFSLRLGMMNPQYSKYYINELTKLYHDSRLFKFLHIPVQSGSNKVLIDMKRKHSVDDFLKSVKTFRSKFPFSTLSTDIIVGFPTETEEDFNNTIDLIKDTKPDIINISRFGSRIGTEAAKLPSLDSKIVKERSRVLHHLSRNISKKNNKAWIGWSGKVLVDEKVNNAFIARNFAYRPILIREELKIGQIVNIRITDVSAYCLIAELK